MRRKTAVILGVSGAALALTASSAFTAGGVTLNQSTAATGFLGGSVEQTVDGTEIASVAYTADSSAKLSQIDITFTDANSDGIKPTITITAGSSTITDWDCTTIATKASSCTPGTTAKPNASAVTKVKFSVA